MGAGRSRGTQSRVSGPDGATYLLQAAPSGFVAWSPTSPQSPQGWLGHVLGTAVVNRLVFRGGWTVTVWRGDQFAPKRETVWKQRYGSQAEAVRAVELLRSSVPRSGPPATRAP